MTYQDAINRARIAYAVSGQIKRAADENPDAPQTAGDIAAQAAAANAVQTAGDERAKADAANKPNPYAVYGSGAAGGALAAGAAYGLAGLFPSLKKRRLLRALIALGVGAPAGVGIGYAVDQGLRSGKIQSLGNQALAKGQNLYGRAKDVGNKAVAKGQQAVDAIANMFSKNQTEPAVAQNEQGN